MIRKQVFCPLWLESRYENIKQWHNRMLPEGIHWLTEYAIELFMVNYFIDIKHKQIDNIFIDIKKI